MSQSRNSVHDKLRKKLEEVNSEQAGSDWLRDLVEWLYQEMLEMEFSEHVGAAPYERTADRRGYRDGYRDRQLHTRVGTVDLHVPRDRDGTFSTQLFERCQRSERALIVALQEAYVTGVSTRKVRRITEKLCGTQFSKDQVSRMARALDEELDRWRQRPLGKDYTYLVIDARYEYIREDGQIASEGVLTVEGINSEGYRQVVGVSMAPGEDATSWGQIFRALIDRGLAPDTVVCATSDDHQGLREALRRYFPHAGWQRCQAHYQRNAASKVLRKDRGEVHNQLRDVFAAPDREEAQRRALQMIEHWSGRVPEFAEWLEETIEQTPTVFHLPKQHRVRLRTTNNLEKLHQEVKRRTRVVRIFPNRRSCLRLVSALAMEQSDEWLTGPRYLTMMEPEPVEEKEEALQPVT